MEEKKYKVFSDDNGDLYIDTGGVPYGEVWNRYEPIKKIIDPHNWKIGERVSDNDFTCALTGSASIIRRIIK